MDEEYFLKKEWKKYIHQQHNFQMDQIQRALTSQEYALQELKCDSLIFYNKAIQVLNERSQFRLFQIRVMPKQVYFLLQIDSKMLPFVHDGPVHTPPNLKYEPPEGDYDDVTFLYDRRQSYSVDSK